MRLFFQKVVSLGVLLHVALFGDSLVHTFLTHQESLPEATVSSIYQSSTFERHYFEKARVSIEHSHFSDIEREYALRLYTKNPNEIKNEERLYRLEKSLSLREEVLKRQMLLKERYMLLSKLVYQHGLLVLARQKEVFLQKSFKKAKYLVQKESDVNTLYRKKEALLDAKLATIKQEQKYQRVLKRIQEVLPFATKEQIAKEVALSLLLSPYRLVDFLSKESKIEDTALLKDHPLLQNSSDKVALAQSRLKALKIKEEFKLDNIEIEYDDSKKRKNALSVGVAVEIPLGENSRRKVSEKIKLLKAKEALVTNRQKLQRKLTALQEEIAEGISYFQLLDAQIQKATLHTQKVGSYKLYEAMKRRSFRLQKERLETLNQMLQKGVLFLYLSNGLERTKLYTFFES